MIFAVYLRIIKGGWRGKKKTNSDLVSRLAYVSPGDEELFPYREIHLLHCSHSALRKRLIFGVATKVKEFVGMVIRHKYSNALLGSNFPKKFRHFESFK